MRRRHVLTTAGAALSAVAGCVTRSDPATTDTPPATTGETAEPDAVALDTLATGLGTPVDVVFAPDADHRYVAEQRGVVRVHDDDGLRPAPLLDLRDTVVTGFEQGLLGLALHPEFATNRRLFVRHSAPPQDGTPTGYSHTFVLSEFTVDADGLRAERASEQTLLEVAQPQPNHNAGSVVFGPDGCLFVGVGDGGAAADQGRGHAEDWYGPVGGGNGQDVTENLLGSVLRIDVDIEGRDDNRPYAVPEDNPLVGRPGLDEQYAWGFRNPWRLAVDGDDLYAGDVGQDRYEEIDRVVNGGNYGWNVREATHCFAADDCPSATPETVRGGESLVPPVVEYPHSGSAVSGVSVIAGNVYRGDTLPGLRGTFVFADFRAGGRLFAATPTDEGRWPTRVLPVTDDDAGRLSRVLSLARDAGELYVLATGDAGGGLYRLASPS